jgi:GMP synthase-like glutamine amidotransferase
MKAALLICDHVPDALSKIHGTYFEMYVKLFPGITLDGYFVIDNELPEVEKYDVVISTGSRYSVYDDIPWIEQLKDMTREIYDSGKKFIGICFGHQLIAESLGGKVEKQEIGYLIGVHNFIITENLYWMKPRVDGYEAIMLCQDQITVLPEKSLVLSASAECPIGMYTVGNTFLGIQGHPEFSKEYNRAIFESRADRIDSDKIEKAIKSLELEPSKPLLTSYLQNFIFG